MMQTPVTVRVTGFVQEQRSDPATIEEAWIPFVTAAEYPLRIISLTSRFDLHGPRTRYRQQVQHLAHQTTLAQGLADHLHRWERDQPVPDEVTAYVTALPSTSHLLVLGALGDGDATRRETWEGAVERLERQRWRQPWLQHYRRMYDQHDRSLALRGLHHFLVAWPRVGTLPDEYAATVARAFATNVQIDVLPQVLPGHYAEQAAWREDACYLIPDEPGLPYLAFLTAAGPLKGTWTTSVIHALLQLNLDVAVCLDVQPVSRTRIELQVDTKITARESQQERGQGSRDARARRELIAARQLQEDLNTQAPHDLRIVVAVAGESPARLQRAVDLVRTAGGMRLPLMRVPGEQGALSRFFTATPTPQITALTRPHRMISHGVAVTIPFGLRKPHRTDGIIWIYERTTPIMFDPFADRRAAHMIVLGKTGVGKTYAINCWQLRMLAEGCQVIFFEPQGHSRRLIRACGAGGARFILDTTQRLNVLDVVAARGEQGEAPSLAMQINHVLTQLSVLLGKAALMEGGEFRFVARAWTNVEQAILTAALEAVYAPWQAALDDLTVDRTPILADLCDALTSLDLSPDLATLPTVQTEYTQVAQRLAAEIYMLLVRGSTGAIFNGRTTVDWDFTADATAYDFSQVPPGTLQVYYYGQAFGALNRMVRDPGRGRSIPIIATIDEFRFMAKAPSLARFAADATKTWRTFGAALWSADQDAHTYLGTAHSSPDEAMLSIWLNSTMKVLFRQDAADAQRIQTMIQGLQPSHAQTITHLGKGRCVLVWEGDDPGQQTNEVYVGEVIANDAEHQEFTGT